MIILKKNIKFLITLFILLGLSFQSNFVYAAGSSGDEVMVVKIKLVYINQEKN